MPISNNLEALENDNTYKKLDYTEAKLRVFTKESDGKFLAHFFFTDSETLICYPPLPSAERRDALIQSNVDSREHMFIIRNLPGLNQ